MFRLQSTKPRLVASTQLTSKDFQCVARRMGVGPFRARKVGYVAARRAEVAQCIETLGNGKESQDVAQPGDYVVTNLSPERIPLRDRRAQTNTYVIRAIRFPELYEPEGDTGP